MAAEIALAPPTVDAGGGWSLPSWLTLIVRKLRRAMLSEDEKRILHLVEFGASTFGERLLAAESLDDLDDRIDACTEDPAFHALLSLMTASLPERMLDGTVPTRDPDPVMSGAFGAGMDDLLREGSRLAATTAEAFGRLLRMEGAPTPQKLADELRASKPLDFLADPRMPPEVALANLGGIKAGVCIMAICKAVLAQARPEPWLARAILERWVEGQRRHLSLLASVPEAGIPLDVIPAAERLDLAQLMRQTNEAEARFRELTQRARETSDAVHPSSAEPDDD